METTKGSLGGSAIRNDHRRNGILVRTELLDVGIVGIGAGGTNHEEIAVAAAAAHPLKCGIYICAAAYQNGARRGGSSDVIGIAYSKVRVLFGGKGGRQCGANRDHDAEQLPHDWPPGGYGSSGLRRLQPLRWWARCTEEEVVRSIRRAYPKLWVVANMASSKRLETPSLSKMLLRWRFTVSSLIEKCCAMSLLLFPERISETISSSRGVRP
jgi:hypothetical protein